MTKVIQLAEWAQKRPARARSADIEGQFEPTIEVLFDLDEAAIAGQTFAKLDLGSDPTKKRRK
jgi:hypothetical protein